MPPRRQLLTGVALAALPLAVYGKMVLPGWAPVGYDVYTYFYPLRHYLAEAWQQGRFLPLWSPGEFMGVPFLANIQTGALYPPNLLFAVLPTEKAIGWSMLIHLALAAAGMFAYAWKTERLGTAGASVSALIYAMGGYMDAHIGHLNQSNTLAWTPLLMLAVDRTLARPRPRMVAFTAIVVGLVILAGHTQQAYFTFILAGIAGLARLGGTIRARGWASLRAPLAAGLAGLGLGLGIAAGQIIPTAELVAQSSRSGGLDLERAGSFALPLSQLVSSQIPDYLMQQNSEYTGYVGMAALALAALAVAGGWRRPRIVLYALLALLAAWVALGPHGRLYDLFFTVLPGLKLFRAPARILLFSYVALALLAGHGVRTANQLALASRRRAWRGRAWAAVAAAAAMVALPAAAVAYQPQAPARLARNLPVMPAADAGAMLAFGLTAVIMVTLVLAHPRRRNLAVLAWTLPALVAVELILASGPTEARHPLADSVYRVPSAATNLIPTGPSVRYLSLAHPTPAPLSADPDAGRYAGFQALADALQPDVALGHDLGLDADGYDGGVLPLDAYVRFRRPLLPPDSANIPDFTITLSTDRVYAPDWLRVAGVGIVITAAATDPNPPQCRCLVQAGSAGDLVAWRLAGASPSRAYLEAGGEVLPATVTLDQGEHVRVRLPGGYPAGTLVLADSYYPGWSARVDGRAARIERVHTMLRGVQVPAAAGEVDFDYEPNSVLLGLMLSGFFTVVAGLLAVFPQEVSRLMSWATSASKRAGAKSSAL